MSAYLPTYLPADQIYQPDAPKPEDVAVLLEGDENIDMDTLRKKGGLTLRDRFRATYLEFLSTSLPGCDPLGVTL